MIDVLKDVLQHFSHLCLRRLCYVRQIVASTVVNMKAFNKEVLPIFFTLVAVLLSNVLGNGLASVVVCHLLCLYLVLSDILIDKFRLEQLFQSLLFLKIPVTRFFLNFF